eukprot:TRINITY_DN2491_c0_g1_i3.p4 TRINITY_DN2491_c0_g1~~TRINITY_DN2491_c0_g1_i3.p4  ORF type:complete len:121 (-),score=9.42 TRINITY_DN2491_c0_g1_i3:62-424(-)
MKEGVMYLFTQLLIYILNVLVDCYREKRARVRVLQQVSQILFQQSLVGLLSCQGQIYIYFFNVRICVGVRKLFGAHCNSMLMKGRQGNETVGVIRFSVMNINACMHAGVVGDLVLTKFFE